MAENSYAALGLAVAAWIFTIAAMSVACMTAGDAPIWAAALGFCGIVLIFGSILFGVFSLREKDKNYILAKTGMAAACVAGLVWIIVLIAAL